MKLSHHSKQRNHLLIAIGIVVGIFYFITLLSRIPLLDHAFFGSHLFRQLQTLSTIEAYTWDGIDLLHPRTNYMGFPGHMLLEFPVFQVVCAFLSDTLSTDPQITTRALNLLIGLLTAIGVYRISIQFFKKPAALCSGFIFLLAPLNLMYHASTLVDPLAVLGCVISTDIILRINFQKKATTAYLILLTMASTMTAVIKPLYLFPVVLIVATDFFQGVAEFRNTRNLTKVFNKERWYIWTAMATAAIALISWLIATRHLSTGHGVLTHLGWKTLLSPGFYITLFLRYNFYIQSPVILLLSIFGILRAITNRNVEKEVLLVLILFTALPALYYLTFANINRPHDYYSLILIPFISVVAGAGVQKLLEVFNKHQYALSILLAATIFVCNGYLYFCNYWLSPNTENRYASLSELAGGILEKGSYCRVYVDRNGPFATNEYLAESRRDIVAYKLGKIDESDLRKKTVPIYPPALLYALNHQYGEMSWYSKDLKLSRIKSDVKTYQDELSYIVFYMASTPNSIKKMMTGYKLICETSEILIYQTQ